MEPDDLTLAQAASLARLSPKTLRRAIARCELPRRYRDTPYGAQLVVSRQELGRWLDSRLPRGVAPLAPLPSLQPALAEQTTRALESRLAALEELAWSVGVLGDRLSELEQRLDGAQRREPRGERAPSPNADPQAPVLRTGADAVFPLPIRRPCPAPGQAPPAGAPWWRRLLFRSLAPVRAQRRSRRSPRRAGE